jgi:hypothetical protein
VRDYELKGIEATQDMQRAARRVANENVGLRTLLAQRGTTAAEVDAFLQAFNNGEVISIARSTVTNDPALVPAAAQCVTPETTTSPGGDINQTDIRSDDPSTSLNSYCSHPSQQQQQPKHPVAAEDQEMDIESEECSQPAFRPSQAQCCSGSRDRNDSKPASDDHNIELEHATTEVLDCPNTSDCFCPPTTTTDLPPPNSGLEISCETAAAIIIDMRGDGDIEAVRASLGCKGREACTVRNSTVLQIMDER